MSSNESLCSQDRHACNSWKMREASKVRCIIKLFKKPAKLFWIGTVLPFGQILNRGIHCTHDTKMHIGVLLNFISCSNFGMRGDWSKYMKNAPGECIFPEVFEVQYQFSFSSDAEESAILSSLKKKINDCSQSAFGWSTHQNLSGAKKKHKIEYHPYYWTPQK